MGFLDDRCKMCGAFHPPAYRCGTPFPLTLKNQSAETRGTPLELEPEWITGLDLGGVHIERLIGGCYISLLLPDGTTFSEEVTGDEFYEIFYRWAEPSSKKEIVTYLAVVMWAFVCVAVAALV